MKVDALILHLQNLRERAGEDVEVFLSDSDGYEEQIQKHKVYLCEGVKESGRQVLEAYITFLIDDDPE